MLGLFKKLFNKKKTQKDNVPEVVDEFKELREYEAQFLLKTDEYDFFGYLIDDGELPVFTTVLEEEKEIFTGTIVYPYTPKMLEHCVKHLVDERKLVEAEDIEDFKIKCNRYAKIAKYQKESWPGMIENLVTYLKDFEKNNKNDAEISE